MLNFRVSKAELSPSHTVENTADTTHSLVNVLVSCRFGRFQLSYYFWFIYNSLWEKSKPL